MVAISKSQTSAKVSAVVFLYLECVFFLIRAGTKNLGVLISAFFSGLGNFVLVLLPF